MVKNLQPGPSWTPGTVTYKAAFSIRIHDGQVWKHHINHFKVLGDQNTQVFLIEPDKSGSKFMNTPSEIFSESTTQQLTVPSSSDTESNTTQAAAVATSPTSSTSIIQPGIDTPQIDWCGFSFFFFFWFWVLSPVFSEGGV